MAIQNRRGPSAKFDPSKLLPGEWAVKLDTKEIYMCYAAGDVRRMATYEEMVENINMATEDVQAMFTEEVRAAIQAATTAEYRANMAATSANNAATSARNAAESANTSANNANAAASNANNAADAVADVMDNVWEPMVLISGIGLVWYLYTTGDPGRIEQVSANEYCENSVMEVSPGEKYRITIHNDASSGGSSYTSAPNIMVATAETGGYRIVESYVGSYQNQVVTIPESAEQLYLLLYSTGRNLGGISRIEKYMISEYAKTEADANKAIQNANAVAQEIIGKVEQIDQNTRGIDALKGDISEIQKGILNKKIHLNNPFIVDGYISSDGSITTGTRGITDFIIPENGYSLNVESIDSTVHRIVRYSIDESNFSYYSNWTTDRVIIPYNENYKYRIITTDNVGKEGGNISIKITLISDRPINVADMKEKIEIESQTRESEDNRIRKELQLNALNDNVMKRRLDAIWKLNEGISYQFETDSETSYQKDVPSGAKLASVKKIGGKTIVWNQLVKQLFGTITSNGVTFANNGNSSITINGTATDKIQVYISRYLSDSPDFVNASGHILYLKACPKSYSGSVESHILVGEAANWSYGMAKDVGNGAIVTAKLPDGTNDIVYGIRIVIAKDTVIDNQTVYPQLIDLTKMFGAGNEPSSVEEIKSMFPDDYYPYDAGTLMSTPVNEIVEQGKNLNVPSKWKRSKIVDYNGTPCIYFKNGSTYGYIDGIFEENTVYTFTFRLIGEGTYYMIICYTDGTYDSLSDVKGGEITTITSTVGKTIQRFGGLWSNGEDIYLDISVLQIEKGLTATPYSPYRQTSHQIPQSILELDGYGDSVSDDVYNYVDWEKKQFVKRVGKVVLDSFSGTWGSVTHGYAVFWTGGNFDRNVKMISNNFVYSDLGATEAPVYSFGLISGANITKTFILPSTITSLQEANEWLKLNETIIYYELAEPVITDISDLIPDDFNPIEVEAGGSLTFKNSNGDAYRVPVPNEVEYAVKLSEVTP